MFTPIMHTNIDTKKNLHFKNNFINKERHLPDRKQIDDPIERCVHKFQNNFKSSEIIEIIHV